MKKIITTTFACVGIINTVSGYAKNINWYVDGSVYAQTSCNDGADVILPTAPTKPGYIFQGWQSTIYDMSILDASVNGDVYYGRTASNTCYFKDSSIQSSQQQACTLSDYSDLELRQWKTLFNYGTVRGEAACSASYGATIGEVGNPDISNPSNGGVYCWCHVTGFIPNGESVVRKPATSNWAFRRTFSSASECASGCTYHCGDYVRGNSSLRASLYGTN